MDIACWLYKETKPCGRFEFDRFEEYKDVDEEFALKYSRETMALVAGSGKMTEFSRGVIKHIKPYTVKYTGGGAKVEFSEGGKTEYGAVSWVGGHVLMGSGSDKPVEFISVLPGDTIKRGEWGDNGTALGEIVPDLRDITQDNWETEINELSSHIVKGLDKEQITPFYGMAGTIYLKVTPDGNSRTGFKTLRLTPEQEDAVFSKACHGDDFETAVDEILENNVWEDFGSWPSTEYPQDKTDKAVEELTKDLVRTLTAKYLFGHLGK